MPDAVLQAMHRASPNIYEGELHELTDSLVPDLKSIAMTDSNVAIYIGNGHAAWEAARRFGCERGVLLKLAKHSEDVRPGDALTVLQAEVQEVLQTADRRNYAEAIGLLRRIQRISRTLGQPNEFTAYAEEVRAANARRPAFCSMFDAAGFLAPC